MFLGFPKNKTRFFSVLLALGILLGAFQNCAPGFSSADLQSTAPDILDMSGNNPLTGIIKKSYIYVGGSSSIKALILDHKTDQITSVTSYPLSSGQSPGWFDYDKISQTLFVADVSGPNLNVLHLTEASGNLILQKTLPFISQAVHIQALRNSSDFSILAASYNQGQYASYKVDFLGETATEQQVFTYASGAHSHSSSFDKGRNLVFVANKDEHRIVIYSRAADGQLAHVGATLVGDPRMVVYDEVFDKVYLATEANTGHSSVVIYNIQENGGIYSLIEAQTFEMGLRGSDLKIDHKHGFVVATVREAGKEGIWALPVTSAGLFDTARMNKFIPVASKEARSLAITADGQYYVVTCNSGQNTSDLLVYKISYDSGKNILTSDLIWEVDLGTGNFQSHYVLSVE